MEHFRGNTGSVLKQANLYRRLAWDIFLYILLAFIGWLSLFSIEYTHTQDVWAELFRFDKHYARQFWWIIVSLVLGVVILNIRSVFITSSAAVLYFLGLIIMVVTVFWGSYGRGSQSWMSVGGVRMQFAELMVVLTVLYLSCYVSEANFNIQKNKYRIYALLIFLCPFVLTILQKEMGVSLVFCVLAIVLYREGIPSYFIYIPLCLLCILVFSVMFDRLSFAIGLGMLGVLIAVIWGKFWLKNKFFAFLFLASVAVTILLHMYVVPWGMKTFLQPYQVKRIYNTFGMSNAVLKSEQDVLKGAENPITSGSVSKDNYNVFQSVIAIGSGGFSGKGLWANTQTRLNFVPEQSTDFIFCAYAESWGFLGSLFLLGIFALVLLRILSSAEQQCHLPQVRAYAYGCVAVLGFHVVVNMSMSMGICPVVGIPLPFVSYGGSSFIAFSILYFIWLRLQADSKSY